jgi:hypothetical protein
MIRANAVTRLYPRVQLTHAIASHRRNENASGVPEAFLILRTSGVAQ